MLTKLDDLTNILVARNCISKVFRLVSMNIILYDSKHCLSTYYIRIQYTSRSFSNCEMLKVQPTLLRNVVLLLRYL